MAPLRVAHVMGKMVGGGLEAVVMNYYRYIDRNAVQFDFLVDSDSTHVPSEEIEGFGGRVIEVPPYQTQPANSIELERLFRTESWQIVHSHMNVLSVIPLRAAKKAEVPVRIAHSHSTWGKGEYARNTIKAVLRTQSRRYPTHLMACGTLAGEWLFGKNARFTVLNNAVDARRFRFSQEMRDRIRLETGAGKDTFVVGHLGRFVTQKNHAKLIGIFSELHRHEPDSLLVLGGCGPLEQQTRDLVSAMSLDGAIRFLGQREDSDALYSAFDCFCLPSLYEGLPVVGIESQFAGLPLVMSDAVSEEASITRRCATMPLVAADADWAEVLLACRGASRELDDEDSDELAPYDISKAAPSLALYYERALSGKGW